jgi:hypothetical protein
VFSEIKEKLLFMETKATLQETVMQAKGIQEIFHDLKQESVFGIEKEMLANVKADVFALKQMIQDRNAESPNSPEYEYFDEENQDFDDDFQPSSYENQQNEMDCTPPHNGTYDSPQNDNWNRENSQEFYSQESNFYSQPQRANEQDCSYNPYCSPMENNERNTNVNAVNQQTNRSRSISPLFLPFMTLLALTQIIGIFGHDQIFPNKSNGILDEITKAEPCICPKNPLFVQNNVTVNLPNYLPTNEHSLLLMVFLTTIVALITMWKIPSHFSFASRNFGLNHQKKNDIMNIALIDDKKKASTLEHLINKKVFIMDYIPSFCVNINQNRDGRIIDKNCLKIALEMKFPSANNRQKYIGNPHIHATRR